MSACRKLTGILSPEDYAKTTKIITDFVAFRKSIVFLNNIEKLISFRERSIFDIPDEILVEILLYLNVNDRVRLANVLGRFDILVLESKKFLRHLDFSEEGRLTSAVDIEQYFGNGDANKLILEVNLCNVICMKTEYLFNNFMSKALNMVDINIHGIELQDLRQLASLLKPLLLVRRLSIDWPAKEDEYRDEILQIIGDPFSRLEYLSVKAIGEGCYDSLLLSLAICKELKTLSIHRCGEGSGNFVVQKCLAKLESLEYYVEYDDVEYDHQELVELLPDWGDWIKFSLPRSIAGRYFYLVKTPEVSEELGNVILSNDFDSWELLFDRLRMDRLLKAVIRINNAGVPENFITLPSELDDINEESEIDWHVPCALRIEEAKLLLKNPRHPIKYLYLTDSIATKSENHLYSFACPSVTELYLSGISKIDTMAASTSKTTDSQKKHLTGPISEFDPCFRTLVENTPLVSDLTLDAEWRIILAYSGMEVDETWDLGPLSLIQGWKNLRSLRLLRLPIRDGEFLIEIGKQCKYLEKLEFYELGSSDACRYTSELSVMLSHCPNLTDFSLRADNFGEVAKLLDCLANNPKLRRVRFKSLGQMNNTTNLMPAVEQLLRRCSRLTTFLCIIDEMSQADSYQLASALRRLRTELSRPSLEFQVTRPSSANEALHMQDTISENSRLPCFPDIWRDCDYQ